MKRTVHVWVSKHWSVEHVGQTIRPRGEDADRFHLVTLTEDDGLPEPAKPHVPGCQTFRGFDCTCTKPAPQTRERRVEGWINPKDTQVIPAFHSRDEDCNCEVAPACLPAVLTWTEPIPEPTLVEAVEGYFAGRPTISLNELMAALARERAKGGK